MFLVANYFVQSLYPIIKDGGNIELEDIFQNEDYTSWTFAFPKEYINTLCTIDITKRDQIIEKWLQIEDCPYNNEKNRSDLLATLIDLATIAQSSNQSLYFRMEM